MIPSMDGMDYRTLLLKYIGFVSDEEGTTFIDRLYGGTRGFSAEEMDELRRLDQEDIDRRKK